MKVAFLVISLFIFIIPNGYAQTTDSSAVLEKAVEYALEAFDPENTTNADEIAEYLQLLTLNPLNINKASLDELLKIPGINFKLAQEILAYREKKPFETVAELAKVKGIGGKTVQKISIYLSVGSVLDIQKGLLLSKRFWFNRGKTEHVSRTLRVLNSQKGYEIDGNYAGDPFRVYQRTTYSSEHLSMNLSLEKDPGEAWRSPMGFDYTSMHIAAKDVRPVNYLILGDYSVAFGQGLVLWNGGAFGKGNDVINAVSRSERGLRPYRSTLESGFQRGIALSFGKTLETTLFLSSKKETASVVVDDTIRFPSASGFHRTETELDRRYNTQIGMMGGRLRYSFAQGWIGLTGYYFESDKYILPASGLQNKYAFSGKSLYANGLDYTYFWRNIAFTGELGRSQNGAFAWLQSLQWIISEETEFSLGIRNYDKKNQSPFSNGFGEGSGTQNEFGIYTGLSHQITDSWLVRVYFDQYEFPWIRFGVNQPTKGYDWLAYSEYRFDRKTSLTLLGRFEKKEDDRIEVIDSREVDVLDPQSRWSVRSDLMHQLTPRFRLRFRLERVGFYDFDQNDKGWSLYQDVRWNVTKNLQIDARLAFFETDSFDARIYQYENDVLYAMLNPVLSGQGQRSYILMKYSPLRKLDLWFKYDISVYENVNTVGSGNDEIQGNMRSRATFQVRYSF